MCAERRPRVWRFSRFNGSLCCAANPGLARSRIAV